MQYLTNWRMQLAANFLLTGTDSVAMRGASAALVTGSAHCSRRSIVGTVCVVPRLRVAKCRALNQSRPNEVARR
jgi:hypothetical protein